MSEEAALVLGRDADLLDRIMEWCEAKDHAGVRGEASRLLAALIRHSQNSVSQIIHLGMFLCLCWSSNSLMFTYYLIFSLQQEVVREVARANGIRHLISMASSEHVIMQNEALVALAIASAIDIGKAVSSSSAEFIRQCSSSEAREISRVCWA